MFENLQEKLQRTFKSLRGQAVLNEENIQEALRELRLALRTVLNSATQVAAQVVGR